MPSRETVRLWLQQYPEFVGRWARAKEAGEDAIVDEAMDSIRNARDAVAIAKARLFLDATRWMAGEIQALFRALRVG